MAAKVIARKVLTEVRRRGSDAIDLRDASHEASHALEFDLRGKWSRDRVHAAVIKRGRGSRFLSGALIVKSEIKARAVEQIVCSRLGVPVESVEVFAGVALLEMGITFGSCPPEAVFIKMIRQSMIDPGVITLAERVIALGCP